MAVVAYFSYYFLSSFTSKSFIIMIANFVISGGISVIAYLLTLISLGGITKEDILVLPKGEKIVNLFLKIKLIK